MNTSDRDREWLTELNRTEERWGNQVGKVELFSPFNSNTKKGAELVCMKLSVAFFTLSFIDRFYVYKYFSLQIFI